MIDIGRTHAAVPTNADPRDWRQHARNVCARFGPGLLRSLVTIANGIPSLAVQLARDTVLAAEREGLTKIARKHLDEVLRDLVTHLRTTS